MGALLGVLLFFLFLGLVDWTYVFLGDGEEVWGHQDSGWRFSVI